MTLVLGVEIMLMQQLAGDTLLVLGLITVGTWLESVGKITDCVDRFLTPLPLGVFGTILVVTRYITA